MTALAEQGFTVKDGIATYTADDNSYWLSVECRDDACYIQYMLEDCDYDLDDPIPYKKVVEVAVEGVMQLMQEEHPRSSLIPVCQL